MELTIKQERFAQKYVECGNATEAYRFAYSNTRMADKTMNEAASRLLSDSKVLARVEELKDDLQKSFEVKKEHILRKLAQIAGLLPTDGVPDSKAPNVRDQIVAIAEINRMLGYNAPSKIAQTDAEGKDVVTPPRIIVVTADGERVEVSDETI
jgi:hypothetical protein